jgi:hypothetical protein
VGRAAAAVVAGGAAISLQATAAVGAGGASAEGGAIRGGGRISAGWGERRTREGVGQRIFSCGADEHGGVKGSLVPSSEGKVNKRLQKF